MNHPLTARAALTLQPASSGLIDAFEQGSLRAVDGRVYGGLLLGQSAAAALKTVDEGRPIHSMHGYFIRPGDASGRLEHRVVRTRDGRSFSVRQVETYQDGKAIFLATFSFQDPASGPEHQVQMPTGIPGYEELPELFDSPSEVPIAEELMHVREVPSELWCDKSGLSSVAWVRLREQLSDDPSQHQAALAFLSDAIIQNPILYAHGMDWFSPEIVSASLDHALWFHDECRADEWLLFVQETSNARDGRGITSSRVFREDGQIVASAVQEILFRTR